FLLLLPLPCSTLFPYTTLFRSAQVCVLLLQSRGAGLETRILVARVLAHMAGIEHDFHILQVSCVRRNREIRLGLARPVVLRGRRDRKSTRLNSSHDQISYAVFC